jgi:diguanylate cyclase (GGDEF)-like protein
MQGGVQGRARLAGQDSGRLYRICLVAILVVAAGLLGVFLTVLQARQEQSYHRIEETLGSVALVRSIDGLEWRAISGEDALEIGEAFELTAADLRHRLADAQADPWAEQFSSEADEYSGAVRDMLVALTSGDTESAEQIDEDRVDPGFEAVLATAETIVERQHHSADRSERISTALMWLSLGATTAGFAGALYTMLGARDQRRESRLRAETDQRLRSFVEGSADVITVVTGHRSLTVMNPTLGVFERFSSGSKADQVSDLLPAREFARWELLDKRLLVDGGQARIEVTLEAPDASVAHVEGHGSLLASDPTQRVWVWRDVTARKELETQLNFQAFHDSLTGVANRSLLQDRVEHALDLAKRSHQPVSVLFCDLDDFKTVNDSLGHGQGDELLKVVTRRLQTCIRHSDTVARLGGDEFAILLEGTNIETASALAERIVGVVGYEVVLDERSVFPSISVGIATAMPGMTTEDLLRNADLAMYTAKQSGKGRYAVYQDQMHQTTSGVLSLQADLRTALEQGQFSLHYQPTVDLSDGGVDGVEALIRWHHPVHGNIPPDQFIPIAEASGMIVAIGRWVLHEACRAAVKLQDQQSRPLLMAVNLSPQQLRDPSIIDTVKTALSDTGLQPDHLVLEVTEGTLLDNSNAVQRLHELRSLGVLIAIDDFGTGYTSISYLQSLPISILKIDRSFVTGDTLAPSERHAFLHAIIGLAKSLNLQTVAEGIETVDQFHQLTQAGCDTGQGYLWSPATPLPETRATIQQIETRPPTDHPASPAAEPTRHTTAGRQQNPL